MAKGMVVELDPHVIQMKVDMDNLVEDIKGLDIESVELEALYKAQIEQLKARFEEKQLLVKGKERKTTERP